MGNLHSKLCKFGTKIFKPNLTTQRVMENISKGFSLIVDVVGKGMAPNEVQGLFSDNYYLFIISYRVEIDS